MKALPRNYQMRNAIKKLTILVKIHLNVIFHVRRSMPLQQNVHQMVCLHVMCLKLLKLFHFTRSGPLWKRFGRPILRTIWSSDCDPVLVLLHISQHNSSCFQMFEPFQNVRLHQEDLSADFRIKRLTEKIDFFQFQFKQHEFVLSGLQEVFHFAVSS